MSSESSPETPQDSEPERPEPSNAEVLEGPPLLNQKIESPKPVKIPGAYSISHSLLVMLTAFFS